VSLLAVLALLYAVLSAARFVLALLHDRRLRNALSPPAAGPLTIVQPILSGDPALEDCLARNLAANPEARFFWMVDNDDPAGQEAATAARLRHPAVAVEIVLGPPPVTGENPKLAKLIRAETGISGGTLIVLDDDTVLPEGGALRLAGLAADGSIATGLPIFAAGGTIAERFVAGFINGQALATYFAMAALGANRTINGMVYAVRSDVLAGFGGFGAAGHELTDDYAVARLWTGNGRKIVQTAVFAEVRITLPGMRAAFSLLRRWLIFANRYLARNSGPATLALVVVPSLLPLAGFLMSAFSGIAAMAAWLVLLFAGAVAGRVLLACIAGRRAAFSDIGYDVLAALSLPVFFLAALWRPNRLRWRSRRIDMRKGVIRYE